MALVGSAWYRVDHWERLREISADPEKLEQTHEEWLASAEKAHQGLRESGMRVEKVELDVEELLTWRETRGLDSMPVPPQLCRQSGCLSVW